MENEAILDKSETIDNKEEEMDTTERVNLLHENVRNSDYDVDRSSKRRYTYEEAISSTGHGRFHWLLLLACGWANAGDAVEVLCVSFLLPSAECDLKLTSADKGWMNAIIFGGMMIGGYMWGSLADIYGRRSMLIYSLVFNGIFGLLSSFAQSFGIFLFLRFLSGIGVGGNIPTVWSYFVEFQPKDKRGSQLSFLATFWMVGNILTAGIAWAVIPQQALNFVSASGFSYNSWRIFVAITTIPCFTASIMIFFLPQSPKFLMEVGKEKDALAVLQYMFCANTGDSGHWFNVRSLEVNEKARRDRLSARWSLRSARQAAAKLLQHTWSLFDASTIRVTTIILIVYFSISFGYYGLWMWFPELYSRLEQMQERGIPVSVCNIEGNQSFVVTPNCSSVNQDTRIYTDSFILSASNLPGNILTILYMDKLGRKTLLGSSMVVTGGSVFMIYFVSKRWHNLVLSCVFGGVSVITWNTLDVLGTELFPTSSRSTALGLCLVAARIGAIIGNVSFGQLIDTDCAVPIMLVAGLLVSGGLTGCLLPNTSHIGLK